MLDTLASHLDSIAALAPVWGFALIFAFMAIESSFIPFPSEIVMIPAGFLAARGELSLHASVPDLVLACAVGIAGSLAGAYFNYYLSAKLGEPFLRKYGKWFFLKPEALDRACEVFNRYGGVTTFVCRLIPVIRQLISIPAGLSKMNIATFTFYTFLGAAIWNCVLALLGYLAVKAGGMDFIFKYSGILSKVIIVLFVLAVAFLVVRAIVRKRKNSPVQ